MTCAASALVSPERGSNLVPFPPKIPIIYDRLTASAYFSETSSKSLTEESTREYEGSVSPLAINALIMRPAVSCLVMGSFKKPE